MTKRRAAQHEAREFRTVLLLVEQCLSCILDHEGDYEVAKSQALEAQELIERVLPRG